MSLEGVRSGGPLPRLVLASFPLFLVLGFLLSRHGRPGALLWLAVSAGSGVALTALVAPWRWVA